MYLNVKNDHNKEHSTSYILENIKDFNVNFIEANGYFSESCLKNYNLAVNNIEQFEAVKNIFEYFDFEIGIKLNKVVKFIKRMRINF